MAAVSALADREVVLTGVPDYEWYAGCFGTASGNLMGYWDRHGLPDLYTGPTGGGVAPLTYSRGIRAFWASKAGEDGRPANQFGHMDDYHVDYGNTDPDPYVTAGRTEHTPDCIGDFIGLSQKRWVNMNGECDGNVDGYTFVYWDKTGARRVNYTPTAKAGLPARDLQSGLRAFAEYRGYQADTFTQLTDFNSTAPTGMGFGFEHLKAEIDAGFPVLLYLQKFTNYYAVRSGMSRGNPEIHGMLAYGYAEYPSMGIKWVYYRTSWASGEKSAQWGPQDWEADMPVRGVIGFRPHPRIRSVTRAQGTMTIAWDGPAALLQDVNGGTTEPVSRYQVERSTGMPPTSWEAVGDPTTDHSVTLSGCCDGVAFYRVRLLSP